MIYAYHFCSQYQLQNGTISHYDGIVRMKDKIESMNGYNEVKQLIADLYEMDLKGENIIIVSLSLINEIS